MGFIYLRKYHIKHTQEVLQEVYGNCRVKMRSTFWLECLAYQVVRGIFKWLVFWL
jgi:hypothetical protein